MAIDGQLFNHKVIRKKGVNMDLDRDFIALQRFIVFLLVLAIIVIVSMWYTVLTGGTI